MVKKQAIHYETEDGVLCNCWIWRTKPEERGKKWKTNNTEAPDRCRNADVVTCKKCLKMLENPPKCWEGREY